MPLLGSSADTGRHVVHLAVVLDFHVPPTAGSADLEFYLDEVVGPALALLTNFDARLGLHFSGFLLEWLVEEHPEVIARTRELVAEGRIEILGGTHYDAILPALPDRDAIAQIQYGTRFLREQLGAQVRGCWLPLCAWDPALVRLLGRSELTYTMVEDTQFIGSGVPEHRLTSHLHVERSSRTLPVLPIDGRLRDALEAGDLSGLIERLELLSLRGTHTGALIAGAAEELLGEGGSLLMGVLSTLAQESHRFKSALPHQLIDALPSAGRATLVQSVSPKLRNLFVPVGAARETRRFVEAAEAAGLDPRGFLALPRWEQLLIRYPEANRLHKRMLRSSARINEFRRVLRKSELSEAQARAVRSALEGACTALWRAQAHDAYWRGWQRAGLLDPGIRRAAYSSLLLADRLIGEATGANRQPFTFQRVDLDSDGAEEITAASPHLELVLRPAVGAGLSDLDLRTQACPLASFVGRLPELEHDEVGGDGVQLLGSGGEAPRYRGARLASQLHTDSYQRLLFLDHFLADETTAQGFSRSAFRSLGDFHEGQWSVDRIGAVEDGGEIHLGRNGVVLQGERRALLRLEKRFHLPDRAAALKVRVRMVNRSNEPMEFWYACEVPMGFPGGDPSACLLSLPRAGRRFVPVAEKVDEQGLERVELVDRTQNMVLRLSASEPMGLWTFPIQTVVDRGGQLQLLTQGVSLVMHRKISLWGHEEIELGFDLKLHISERKQRKKRRPAGRGLPDLSTL